MNPFKVGDILTYVHSNVRLSDPRLFIVLEVDDEKLSLDKWEMSWHYTWFRYATPLEVAKWKLGEIE